MKLFALAALLATIPGLSFAFGESSMAVSQSSFTLTNDTTRSITTASGTPRSLDSVIVSSSSVGGTITLYDSNGTATNRIGVVSLGTVQQAFYNIKISSGITYTTNTNSGGVTIIYTPR